MVDKLTIISYNLHGLTQGKPGIDEIILKIEPDLIMVQEHWLTPDNFCKLNSLSSKYFVFGSSAMNSVVNSGPLYGRPFGGTAILINNEHVSSIVCITTSDRFTAIKLHNWLFITVYMPCVGTVQRDELYLNILADLQAIISDHSECHCFIGGDFNIDLNSQLNINLTVNEFIEYNSLSRCDVIGIHISMNLIIQVALSTTCLQLIVTELLVLTYWILTLTYQIMFPSWQFVHVTSHLFHYVKLLSRNLRLWSLI